MSGPWASQFHRLAGWDLETTGVDVEADRVVTAAVTITHPAGAPTTRTWLINPGVEIPEGATAVHGITTAHAQAHGVDPMVGLAEIVAALADAIGEGRALAGMNLGFDFTVLDRDCRRHGVPTLGEVLGGDTRIRPVVDAYVLDKMVDAFRAGKRTLTDLCATYGVRIGEAHTADGDVLAVLRVLWVMGRRSVGSPEQILASYGSRWFKCPGEIVSAWNRIGYMGFAQLHEEQIAAARVQGESYHRYKTGAAVKARDAADRAEDGPERERLLAEAAEHERVAAGIDGSWPIRPWAVP